MIPQEKSEAVTRGLREAFGVTEFDDISAMTGGHTSSLVFRIIVRGSPYLLKIIRRADDPTRHYTSMTAAAEAGVAPRVWYTSIEDKISITDFVKAEPLPVSEALVRLPAVLRTLHALPPFGRAPFNTSCTFLLNKGPAWTGLDGFLQRFRPRTYSPKPKARSSSPATRKWPRCTRMTMWRWCRVITTYSSRTTSCSTDSAYGSWTGRPRS